MLVFDAEKVCKNPRPGGQRLFSPQHPDYEKIEKYIDPSWLAIPKRPRQEGSRKTAAHKPTERNEQPRHEVEEAISGQSNETKTIPRWRRELKRNKTEPPKHQTSRNKQNKKSTNREDNESKECRHKSQVGPKEGSCPNTKTTKQQRRSNNESLTHLNTFQQHPTRTCSVDERHPPKKQNCSKDILPKLPKGKQNEILVVSIFSSACQGLGRKRNKR